MTLSPACLFGKVSLKPLLGSVRIKHHWRKGGKQHLKGRELAGTSREVGIVRLDMALTVGGGRGVRRSP